MWARIDSADIRTVIHYLGTLLVFIGFTMFAPLLLALVAGERGPAYDFAFAAGLTVLLGIIMRFARLRPPDIDRRQALIVTGLIWIVASLAAAVPLYLSGHFLSYVDALFEAVSGYTDTGSVLVQDLDHMADSHNLWRFILQLVGGQGIIVIALGMGLFARFSGSGALYSAEGRSDRIVPRLADTARFIAGISAVFVGTGTLALTIVGLTIGLPPARAVFHGFTVTISAFHTGGFSPMSTSFIYYHSAVYEIVAMIIMLSGMFSFALYVYAMLKGPKEFLKDIEVRTIAVWIAIVLAILIATMARDPWMPDIVTTVRRGLFMVVSAASNTGFTVLHTEQLGSLMLPGTLFALILAMAMGGATSSTTGGIKALRVGIVFKAILAEMRTTLSPPTARSSTRYEHMGSRIVDKQEVSSAMSIFLLFIFMYIGAALVGVAYGYEPLHALFESVAVTSNAGLTSGVVTASMPEGLKFVYIFAMLAGRLEFMALLTALAGIVVSVRGTIDRKVARRGADG